MSTHSHGSRSVFAALVGNSVVTLAKFVAAIFSGSAVMLAESIHSLADTLNQGLLAIGLKRSKKEADDLHSYGYGNERFFWAVISACGLLFVGAGRTTCFAIRCCFERNITEKSINQTHHFSILPHKYII